MTEEVKTEAEKGQEQMDAANLFREEIYTDRKIGVIRCLVPVTAEGKVDESRKVIYTGEAQIMTQMGALPISFDIKADNLAAAVASKIVVPGQPGFTPPEGAGGSGLVMP